MKLFEKREEADAAGTIEAAIQLLRECGPLTWAWWLIGCGPFVTAAFFFSTDMARSPSADRALAGWGFVLSLMYWWMKVGQSIFAGHLMAELRGVEAAKLDLRGLLQLAVSQLMIHSTAWWVLTLAAVVMFPFPWAYALFHNSLVFGTEVAAAGGGTRELLRVAWRQSQFSPMQNHKLVTITCLVGCLIFVNLWVAVLAASHLHAAFTGFENLVSRDFGVLLRPASLMGMGMVTFLVVGPFVRAVYVVRCFEGVSRSTGEDLLRGFRRASQGTMLLGLCAMLLLGAQRMSAVGTHAEKGTAAVEAPREVGADELARGISEVQQRRIYRWRVERFEPRDRDSETWMGSFFRDVGEWSRREMRRLRDALDSVIDRYLKSGLRKLRLGRVNSEAEGQAWGQAAGVSMRVLAFVLGAILVAMLMRRWRLVAAMRSKVGAGMAVPPDLESEEILATEMETGEWQALAEAKLATGDLRLAMRALFLGALAHLNERKLITVGTARSNGDYLRDVRLRAAGDPLLGVGFARVVSDFERVWYGRHEIKVEQFESFRRDHQKLTGHENAT